MITPDDAAEHDLANTMITLQDYLMGRDKIEQPSEVLLRNAEETIYRANLLLSRYYQANPDAERVKVTSGYRPAVVNAKTLGAAPRSKHLTCEAVDLSDPEGELDEWCEANIKVLQDIGLWMESPGATKGWTHLQIIGPKSGKRVFYP
jgi:hypothetical protein